MIITRPSGETPRELYEAIHRLVDILERGLPVPAYKSAEKPVASATPTGTIIYVSDGGPGAQFQGNASGAWVNLG